MGGNKFFLVFTAAMAVFVLSANVAQADTFTVTLQADDADGTCDADCTLREAIIAANSNSGSDTIVVPAGTYNLSRSGNDNTASLGDLDLTDTSGTLTIQGDTAANTIIDGTSNGSDPIFEVRPSTTVELHDITVQNGLDAGVYMTTSSGADLTIQDSIIDNNSTSGAGGGLYCHVATISLTNVTVSNNESTGAQGGGLFSSGCDTTIDRSVFDSNTADMTGGGLHLSNSNAGADTITDTEFIDNIANGTGGGGMYSSIGSSRDALELNRVLFYSNEAPSTTAFEGDGGGLFHIGGIDATNVTIDSNEAASTGGGAYLADTNTPTMDFAHVTVTNNFADSNDDGTGDGGGIRMGSAGSTINMNGSIMAVNYEGDPAGDSADWVSNDCDEGGDFASMDYSLLGTNSNCTPATSTNNTIAPAALSYLFTADISDRGGEVRILGVSSDDITDAIPSASCEDALGATLTTDARGLTRPENTNCDMGAFELDQTDPVISVTSGTDTIECSVDTWSDAGATVADTFDSTVSSVSTAGTVTEETAGEYTITYSSTDADYDGNTASNQTRTVTVQDTNAPTITVTGEAEQTIGVGDSYTDDGATATDICDSSVNVSTSGSVDTATAGTYTLTYSASDDSGNSATQKTRTVIVEAGDEEDGEGTTETITTRTNGKYLRVFVNGEKSSQKKVGKKKLKKRFRKLKTKKLYNKKQYTTVAYLAARKNKATLTVFRLTPNNTLKKKVSRSFRFQKRNKLTLQLKKKNKRIVVTVGKKSNRTKKVFKLTKKGKLRIVR